MKYLTTANCEYDDDDDDDYDDGENDDDDNDNDGGVMVDLVILKTNVV